jgi:hypothetical protein
MSVERGASVTGVERSGSRSTSDLGQNVGPFIGGFKGEGERRNIDQYGPQHRGSMFLRNVGIHLHTLLPDVRKQTTTCKVIAMET